MVKLCSDYTNSQGTTYKGCGQPLKWIDEQPLTKVGEWPGGRTRYAGHYEHYDGSPSRHDSNNPPSKAAYQQTYATQIEKEDQDQARKDAQVQSQGFQESKYGSMFKQYMDESIGTLRDAAVSLETKAGADNRTLANLGKNIDEMREEFKLLHEKVDAALATISFKTGADLYKEQQHQHTHAEPPISASTMQEQSLESESL